MPMIGEPDGSMRRVAPSVARRQCRKGWIHPLPQWPGVYIRAGSPQQEAAARRAAEIWERRQQEAFTTAQEENARQERDEQARAAAKALAEQEAWRAWRRRLALHAREIQTRRGLSPSVPLEALALSRRVKAPRLVAHGRGQAVVGAAVCGDLRTGHAGLPLISGGRNKHRATFTACNFGVHSVRVSNVGRESTGRERERGGTRWRRRPCSA